MQGVTNTLLGDVKFLCPVVGDAGMVEPYGVVAAFAHTLPKVKEQMYVWTPGQGGSADPRFNRWTGVGSFSASKGDYDFALQAG
jgi:hypothetical protein